MNGEGRSSSPLWSAVETRVTHREVRSYFMGVGVESVIFVLSSNHSIAFLFHFLRFSMNPLIFEGVNVFLFQFEIVDSETCRFLIERGVSFL